MTTIVSQTASESNTKNTKDNRKIVVATYFRCYSAFKIPDNLDLEDTTIVEGWGVKWNQLHITYTTKENYILYVGKEPEKDKEYERGDKDNLTQDIQLCQESEVDYKWPEDQAIAEAEDYCVEYEEDDADEQKVEEKVKAKVKAKVEETLAEKLKRLNDLNVKLDNFITDFRQMQQEVEEKVEEKETFYVMVEKCVKDGLLRERFETFQTAEEARTDYETECACRGVAVGERYRVEFGTCNEDGQPDDTIEFFKNYETFEDTDEEEEEEEEDEADVVEKKVEEKVEEKVANTKNTKENRKVLVARYTDEAVYRLPNNLDLEDESVVKEYWVKWGELFISYTSLENWEKYTTQAEDEEEFTQEVSIRNLPSPQWIQAIQVHYDCDSEHKNPDKTDIEDAENFGVEYEQDEDFVCECCLNKMKTSLLPAVEEKVEHNE
jgi:hypothetical protein